MTSMLKQMPLQKFIALGFAPATTGLSAEKIAPLVERVGIARPVESQKTTLPLLATANDVRELIRYLKKHPDGVTIVEALGEVKKRILDPRKISAYEAWGIVDRHGDWLQLSELGWGFSRKLASEAALFRSILDHVESYRRVLELAHTQQLKLITQEDIARFWRTHFSDVLDLHQPKTVESNVVCFLHLCQAAELGSLTVGKRGQPARMRIDVEELEEFVRMRWDSWMTEPVMQPELRPVRANSSNLLTWQAGRLRVCLSVRSAQHNAEQLQSLLELVGIESELLAREANPTLTMSESAFEIMRRSDAGLFVVTPADCQLDEQGSWLLKPEVQAEISAAYLFYNRRVLLLWDERVPVPTDWQNLTRCTFVSDELTWETGLQLTKALLAFKR